MLYQILIFKIVKLYKNDFAIYWVSIYICMYQFPIFLAKCKEMKVGSRLFHSTVHVYMYSIENQLAPATELSSPFDFRGQQHRPVV